MTDDTLHRRLCAFALAVCAGLVVGCLGGPPYAAPPGVAMAPGTYDPQFPVAPPQNNPVFIPCQDPNLIWDQLVDVVDDYFEIASEDRVKMIGDIPTEGRLNTVPRGSSTIFEPWNRDSVTRHERWEATLQSMRRIGTFRVMAVESGFAVDVVVLKELEDVDRPDAVFVGDESLRNDDSIRRFSNNINGGGANIGWIPKGRDIALEQEIIWQLQARFMPQMSPQVPIFMSENPPAQPASTAEWKPAGAAPTVQR